MFTSGQVSIEGHCMHGWLVQAATLLEITTQLAGQ